MGLYTFSTEISIDLKNFSLCFFKNLISYFNKTAVKILSKPDNVNKKCLTRVLDLCIINHKQIQLN